MPLVNAGEYVRVIVPMTHSERHPTRRKFLFRDNLRAGDVIQITQVVEHRMYYSKPGLSVNWVNPHEIEPCPAPPPAPRRPPPPLEDVVRIYRVIADNLCYRCLFGADYIVRRDAERVDPTPFPWLRAAKILIPVNALLFGWIFGKDYLTHERITQMQSVFNDVVQGGIVRTAIDHSLSGGVYIGLAWLGLVLIRGVGKDLGRLGDRRRRIAAEKKRGEIEADERLTTAMLERNTLIAKEEDRRRALKAEKKSRKLREMAEMVGRLQPHRLEERSDGRGQQLLVVGQPTAPTKEITVGSTVEFLGPVDNHAQISDGRQFRDVKAGDRVEVESVCSPVFRYRSRNA